MRMVSLRDMTRMISTADARIKLAPDMQREDSRLSGSSWRLDVSDSDPSLLLIRRLPDSGDEVGERRGRIRERNVRFEWAERENTI